MRLGFFTRYVRYEDQFTVWTSGMTFEPMLRPHGDYSVMGTFTCICQAQKQEARHVIAE